MTKATHGPLTPTQLKVLTLIAQGHSSGEVANQLFVSKRTIDFHLDNIYKVLGCNNRLQAINIARKQGYNL